MKRNLRILLLKKELDHLLRLHENVYFKLRPYLEERSYTKGKIIKELGQLESHARFVYKGYIAKMRPSKKGRDFRLRVFSPGKVASDFESFFYDEPSDFYLKAITYVSTFELKNEVEKILLKEVPEVAELASFINREILKESIHWHHSFTLSRKEGYRNMRKNFPLHMNFFSNKDLAFLMKCSTSKINDMNKELFNDEFGL